MAKRNPNSETAILSPLIEFLEICSNQGRLRYFRAHPIRLASKNGRIFPVKVRPSQRGAPDLIVFIKDWPAVFIEGKSNKGKASNEQLEWQAWAERTKHHYFQPRTHGDVNAVIQWIRERI